MQPSPWIVKKRMDMAGKGLQPSVMGPCTPSTNMLPWEPVLGAPGLVTSRLTRVLPLISHVVTLLAVPFNIYIYIYIDIYIHS